MSDQDNQEPTVVSDSDTLTSLLQNITNSEGVPKYTSPEEALKGAAHAQTHISTLEQENARLKEEREKMEEMINNMNTKQPEPTPAPTSAVATSADTAPVDIDSLFEQFTERLTAKQRAEQEASNQKQVLESAQKAFGDKTEAVLRSKASELGMTTDELLNLAATKPKAFNTLVGLSGKPTQTSSFTTSSVNTTALPQNQNTQEYKNPLLTGRSKDRVALWDSL